MLGCTIQIVVAWVHALSAVHKARTREYNHRYQNLHLSSIGDKKVHEEEEEGINDGRRRAVATRKYQTSSNYRNSAPSARQPATRTMPMVKANVVIII
jgi:23S rRNA maturation mini-RNase III